MKIVKWIGQVMGARKWLVALLGMIQSILAISGIVFALLMRRAIDCAVAGEMTSFHQSVIGIAILILLQIGMRAINRAVEDDTKAMFDNRLRQKLFHGILKSDYSTIKEYHTGELMNRITSDVTVITDGAVTLLPTIASMVVRVTGIFLVMQMI